MIDFFLEGLGVLGILVISSIALVFAVEWWNTATPSTRAAIAAALFVLAVAVGIVGGRAIAERQRCVTLAEVNAPTAYEWHFYTGCLTRLDTGKWIYAVPSYGGG